ncbi:MAG: hypothetical protein NDJ89_05555 [Oligoflexia bacterium]|nr:hypothetical protein [Oligoflexia bacterium]
MTETQSVTLDTIYKGSVKNLRGPARVGDMPALVFEYSDAYSVFDWGRMPDPLPRKGEALALLAADWLERLESPEAWKDFSRSPVAHALRKANRFGSGFIELGEQLQARGLRTHYLGALAQAPDREALAPERLAQLRAPLRHLAVRRVSAVKPALGSILGRAVPDYLATRSSPAPRLVPLEVVFRFSCPEGSSLIERVAKDSSYLAQLGFADYRVAPGQSWDFPVLELFTKLEASDRPLTLSEALAISGLSATQLQELLLRTAWVAGFLKALCARSRIELADGKLEWGVDADGGIFLVDAIGPDELRLLKDGVQLSKEFLRKSYRETPWYAAVGAAKRQAKLQGTADWKRLVGEGPPHLAAATQELGSQLYMALANELTGRRWFESAWKLEQVVEAVKRLGEVGG